MIKFIIAIALAVATLTACDDNRTPQERAAAWQRFNAVVQNMQADENARMRDLPAPVFHPTMPPPPQMTQCRWNGPVWQCQ